MTLEEKKAALLEKRQAIEILTKELESLERDESEVNKFSGLMASDIEVRQLNIVARPSTGEALKATIVDEKGNSYTYSTETPTTMHMTAIQAALDHAAADLATRKTEAEAKLDALI